MTNKSRKTRRNNSRQAALDFLTNITLGSEHEKDYFSQKTIFNPSQRGITQYGTLSVVANGSNNDNNNKGLPFDSSDSNSSSLNERVKLSIETNGLFATTNYNINYEGDDNIVSTTPVLYNSTTSSSRTSKGGRRVRRGRRPSSISDRRLSTDSFDSDIQQYELTREDSQRPIASEKIKKRSDSYEKDTTSTSMSIMSVLRYYKGMINQPKSNSKKEQPFSHATKSYVHRHLSTLNMKYRDQLSYSHFLLSSDSLLNDYQSYDPYYFVDNSEIQNKKGKITSITKKEINEQFKISHPDMSPEITFSKVSSIKKHLLNVAKTCDLEISSLSHAYVYFEKLVKKHVVTKKNRKLIAACCLFLATKINEPRGVWGQSVYEAVSTELNVSSKAIKDNEFAVFADLEFNLYIPRREFMPHFEKIFQILELEALDYLGTNTFYEVDGAYEISINA